MQYYNDMPNRMSRIKDQSYQLGGNPNSKDITELLESAHKHA